jgi:predicted  nucleic acid-binding Zn-ribbon protein
MLDDRKKQLTENNSNLTISHKKTVRMIKEYESVKHRIQQIQTRREDLRQQIAKQQEYFEDISRKRETNQICKTN